MRVGFIGAGPLARAIVRPLVLAGHEVMISNSRGPETLFEEAKDLGCAAGTSHQAAEFGDIVVLAIPFMHVPQLDALMFAGKIVLDATNHYPARDGGRADLDEGRTTCSEIVARQLPQSRIVKAFNSIMQSDVARDGRPAGAKDRRALPIAGDDPQAKSIAAALVNDVGLDPFDAGSLADSWRFERAMPAYCMWLDRNQLQAKLDAAKRGVEVPHGAWREASLVRSQALLGKAVEGRSA